MQTAIYKTSRSYNTNRNDSVIPKLYVLDILRKLAYAKSIRLTLMVARSSALSTSRNYSHLKAIRQMRLTSVAVQIISCKQETKNKNDEIQRLNDESSLILPGVNQ
ncbi:hypothetical protein AVEN_72932-1 [Araneus ventricosus]|uniref:Uncharacterized protein n=1 Tax=Araneus ventricosus TaxID=182803 RepID=A0A4Y2GVE7_ARAVE|nr:hypothetical protein AVEN_72932-1 [Araneus ventricosus]